MTEQLSITGKKWELRQSGAEGFQLARALGVSDVVGHILVNRGFSANQSSAALQFLSPKLSDLPDPLHLKDMEKAVDRLIKAIKANEKIAVLGDYDVDGSCAAALLLRYFAQLGIVLELYIPDRLSEGYGPNPLAMERLHSKGVSLIVTVDCGSLAFEAMARAAELGMDVIITDHHQTKVEKPACVALLNPNRIDEESPCTMLAGVGVAFYMLMALNRALRAEQFFNAEQPEPNLLNLLDLVALATVCDMVPLTGPNRVLVDRGLKVASQRKNLGLEALAHAAGCDEALNVYAAGFQLGPRINAGGRISACDLGATLLSCSEKQQAQALAIRLDNLNEERKELEKHTLAEALHLAEKQFTPQTLALVLAQKGWHPGVVGIVASRVKEQFHRPVFVLAEDENGMLKGSGRSISGVDLGRAVIQCGDVLVAGGGHAMAAGVTLTKNNLPAFIDKLNAHIEQQLVATKADVLVPKLKLDGLISPATATAEFMELLKKIEPFGTGNPEPRFVLSDVVVSYAKQVGADASHLQLTLKGRDGSLLKGIAFRAMETPLGDFLLNSGPRPVAVAGVLRQDVFMGRSQIKLQVADAHADWRGL